MEKQEIIEEIKGLISTTGEDSIEINPNYLEYFQLEELVAIKEQLVLKKSQIKETTSLFLDEIYEKTKED